MTGHTATPWKNEGAVVVAVDASGKRTFIAMVSNATNDYRTRSEQLKDAAFIARAANNYDEMQRRVERAEAITEELATMIRVLIPFVGYDGVDTEPLKEKARAVADEILGVQK